MKILIIICLLLADVTLIAIVITAIRTYLKDKESVFNEYSFGEVVTSGLVLTAFIVASIFAFII